MILYIENPKESTKDLLDLKNKFFEVIWYKINIQKLVLFVYICSEQCENEQKNLIL